MSLSERDKDICEWREQGNLSYQAIGDMYGISRERVRQILKVHGKAGDWFSMNRIEPIPCKVCGKMWKPRQRAHAHYACSKVCNDIARSERAKARNMRFLRQAIALRSDGKTWRQVASETGLANANTAAAKAFRLADKWGVQLPRAPWRGGRGKRGPQQ